MKKVLNLAIKEICYMCNSGIQFDKLIQNLQIRFDLKDVRISFNEHVLLAMLKQHPQISVIAQVKKEKIKKADKLQITSKNEEIQDEKLKQDENENLSILKITAQKDLYEKTNNFRFIDRSFKECGPILKSFMIDILKAGRQGTSYSKLQAKQNKYDIAQISHYCKKLHSLKMICIELNVSHLNKLNHFNIITASQFSQNAEKMNIYQLQQIQQPSSSSNKYSQKGASAQEAIELLESGDDDDEGEEEGTMINHSQLSLSHHNNHIMPYFPKLTLIQNVYLLMQSAEAFQNGGITINDLMHSLKLYNRGKFLNKLMSNLQKADNNIEIRNVRIGKVFQLMYYFRNQELQAKYISIKNIDDNVKIESNQSKNEIQNSNIKQEIIQQSKYLQQVKEGNLSDFLIPLSKCKDINVKLENLSSPDNANDTEQPTLNYNSFSFLLQAMSKDPELSSLMQYSLTPKYSHLINSQHNNNIQLSSQNGNEMTTISPQTVTNTFQQNSIEYKILTTAMLKTLIEDVENKIRLRLKQSQNLNHQININQPISLLSRRRQTSIQKIARYIHVINIIEERKVVAIFQLRQMLFIKERHENQAKIDRKILHNMLSALEEVGLVKSSYKDLGYYFMGSHAASQMVQSDDDQSETKSMSVTSTLCTQQQQKRSHNIFYSHELDSQDGRIGDLVRFCNSITSIAEAEAIDGTPNQSNHQIKQQIRGASHHVECEEFKQQQQYQTRSRTMKTMNMNLQKVTVLGQTQQQSPDQIKKNGILFQNYDFSTCKISQEEFRKIKFCRYLEQIHDSLLSKVKTAVLKDAFKILKPNKTLEQFRRIKFELNQQQLQQAINSSSFKQFFQQLFNSSISKTNDIKMCNGKRNLYPFNNNELNANASKQVKFEDKVKEDQQNQKRNTSTDDEGLQNEDNFIQQINQIQQQKQEQNILRVNDEQQTIYRPFLFTKKCYEQNDCNQTFNALNTKAKRQKLNKHRYSQTQQQQQSQLLTSNPVKHILRMMCKSQSGTLEKLVQQKSNYQAVDFLALLKFLHHNMFIEIQVVEQINTARNISYPLISNICNGYELNQIIYKINPSLIKLVMDIDS